MKKLFLVLILSFFPAQSFAGSCPDGSDPVKSISADGTYFVYNCGGNNTSTKTNNSATSSKKSLTEIKKSMDDDGILQQVQFSPLNAPHAINPVSVSDFSIIGKTSIRFESNDGECGQEPRWNDCPNDRERTELTYGDEYWKTEKWYRFYLYLPKDYNSVAPSNMSLIQWKRLEPSRVLIMFHQVHAGLTFHRNGETFPDSDIVLKSNEDLLGNWTEIIFNTNWHPDPGKGFMKVWIDGKLKVDIKGRANINSIEGRELSLRYGLYNSYMSYYKNTFKTKKMPQRIAFYDGVKAEKNCQKLLDLNTCENLVSQNIKEYKLFMHNSDDKELHSRSICKISSASFEAVATRDDYDDLCTFVKPTELFTTIEASDAFDGSYSFTLSRFNPSEGSITLGAGLLEILDGKISVAKNSRTLETSSTSYYDTFEGQIDKEGNIIAVFNVNALYGKGIPQPVVFTGTIDPLQIKGKFSDYHEIIIQIKPTNESAKSDEKVTTTVKPTELFATIETSDAFDGSYSFKLSLLHSMSGNSKRIGNGYIEINNGIMTVAKDGRSIVNGSEDLYDSFEGRIDKKGNIISWLTIIPQCSTTDMTLVGLDLKGHIKRQIKNKCFVDNDGGGADFDVVLKLRKKE